MGQINPILKSHFGLIEEEDRPTHVIPAGLTFEAFDSVIRPDPRLASITGESVVTGELSPMLREAVFGETPPSQFELAVVLPLQKTNPSIGQHDEFSSLRCLSKKAQPPEESEPQSLGKRLRISGAPESVTTATATIDRKASGIAAWLRKRRAAAGDMDGFLKGLTAELAKMSADLVESDEDSSELVARVKQFLNPEAA